MDSSPAGREQRLLLLAPTPRDAALSLQILDRAGLGAQACDSLEQLCSELDHGAGAVLISEESFARHGHKGLTAWLGNQPPWSDLPVLLIARAGADSPVIAGAFESLQNLTVLERPIRVAALVSSVRTALRARARQYDLRGHLERLRVADRRKDEFLAILAHELRNPLAPVRLAITILRQGKGDAPALHQMIERQVNTMVRLVDDLLEASRYSSGKIELQKKTVDIGAVLRRALETSQPLISAAQHELSVEIPQQPVMMEGDDVRLAQVFSNLLNNAAKYTPNGGSISLALTEQDGQAVIRVRDNGVGLSCDALTQVFELFVQVRDTRHAQQGGLGIGLTLVKALVELHGGTIVAASDGPGHGSLFSVTLPLTAVVVEPSRAAAGTATDLGHRRILVVDDNRDAADSLAQLLQIIGADTHVAYSGDSALRVTQDQRFDIAIVDIGMPGMDGYEVAQRLRKHEPSSHMALIALTGWGQDEDRARSREAGFDHHMVKPVEMSSLETLLLSLTK